MYYSVLAIKVLIYKETQYLRSHTNILHLHEIDMNKQGGRPKILEPRDKLWIWENFEDFTL
jgi:hypothetical protein